MKKGVLFMDWQKAAHAYRNAKNKPVEKPRVTPIVVADNSFEIARAATELGQFLNSIGGSDALYLLDTSGRHIIFGEENDGGGYGTVYYIDGTGLKRSIEAMGTWVAYSKNIKKPEIRPITHREAVEAAVRFGGKNPADVLRWICDRLDDIAKSAPVVDTARELTDLVVSQRVSK